MNRVNCKYTLEISSNLVSLSVNHTLLPSFTLQEPNSSTTPVTTRTLPTMETTVVSLMLSLLPRPKMRSSPKRERPSSKQKESKRSLTLSTAAWNSNRIQNIRWWNVKSNPSSCTVFSILSFKGLQMLLTRAGLCIWSSFILINTGNDKILNFFNVPYAQLSNGMINILQTVIYLFQQAFLAQENATFWDTPADKIIATR